MRTILLRYLFLSLPAIFCACTGQVLDPFESNVSVSPEGSLINLPVPLHGYSTNRTDSLTTIPVQTVSQLLSALSTAKPGAHISISGNVELDLSNHHPIKLPGGVTLMGDRGIKSGSFGALLYSDDDKTYPLIQVLGSNARVEGLRIQGPHHEIENRRSKTPKSNAISVVGHDSFVLFNADMSGWSYAGLRLVNSLKNQINSCFIHHNRRYGLGYGIVLDGNAEANISKCLFDSNRHSIAGSGVRTQKYAAQQNLVLPHANGHAFDMHGEHQKFKNSSPIAGGNIVIRNNIFCLKDYPAFYINGVPRNSALLSNNVFAHPNKSKAVIQFRSEGNVKVADNSYGASFPLLYRFDHQIWQAVPTNWVSWAGFDLDRDGTLEQYARVGKRFRLFSSKGRSWQPVDNSPLLDMIYPVYDSDGLWLGTWWQSDNAVWHAARDTREPRLIKMPPGHSALGFSRSISPDSSTLLSTDAQSLAFWRLPDLILLRKVVPHPKVNPDDHILVDIGPDQPSRLLAAGTGTWWIWSESEDRWSLFAHCDFPGSDLHVSDLDQDGYSELTWYP